jgi:hypothetical protein
LATTGSTLGLVVATTAVETTVVTGSALGGLVNTNGASIELLVVHILHGSIRLGIVAETDKTETTAAVGVTIPDNNLRVVKKSLVWYGKAVAIKKMT